MWLCSIRSIFEISILVIYLGLKIEFSTGTVVNGMLEFSDLLEMAEFTEVPGRVSIYVRPSVQRE